MKDPREGKRTPRLKVRKVGPWWEWRVKKGQPCGRDPNNPLPWEEPALISSKDFGAPSTGAVICGGKDFISAATKKEAKQAIIKRYFGG